MNTPIEWSGRTCAFRHNSEDWKDKPLDETVPKGVRKVWMLDVQGTTCPVEVEDQVRDLWRLERLGNDRYILQRSITELIEWQEGGIIVERWAGSPAGWVEGPLKTDAIVQYLREQGVPNDEQVIIHWWW